MDPTGNCNYPDGILWYIDQNSANLASGVYPNGGSQTFATGTGGAGLNTVAVNAGDVIYLAIDSNANFYCDSTRVDLSINVTSAPTVTPTPTMTFTPTATPTNTPVPTATNSYTYNRTAAVSYADTWAHERNNVFPNYGTTCGCDDCTNYISQVLYNGDYPLRPGNWDANDEFQWWYRADDNDPSTDENSKTWSATDWFKSYIEHYDDEFSEFVVNPNPPVPQGGDFILLDLRNNIFPLILIPDGLPDHGRALVGYGYTSTDQRDYTNGCGNNDIIPDSALTLLANQHCTDRWHVAWDYNIDFNIQGFWYIHIID